MEAKVVGPSLSVFWFSKADHTGHSERKKKRRGRQKKRWEDTIKEWIRMDFASFTRAVENRTRWKRDCHEVISRAPVTFQLRDRIK